MKKKSPVMKGKPPASKGKMPMDSGNMGMLRDMLISQMNKKRKSRGVPSGPIM